MLALDDELGEKKKSGDGEAYVDTNDGKAMINDSARAIYKNNTAINL